ncbi:hypothetical protein BDV10DRAFT_114618 [Aspergillus recurvatus]
MAGKVLYATAGFFDGITFTLHAAAAARLQLISLHGIAGHICISQPCIPTSLLDSAPAAHRHVHHRQSCIGIAGIPLSLKVLL